MYISEYNSPIGKIIISADDYGVTGLWFDGAKYFGSVLDKDNITKSTKDIKDAEKWLDIYFGGGVPDFTPRLHFIGTPFRQMIWQILLEIPYGSTMTYSDISKKAAKQMGVKSMSAQAVGGAVGHNPISLIVPCHRVIGADGSLTGYAGGVDKKKWLLCLEKVK